jgi:hypothetical protein
MEIWEIFDSSIKDLKWQKTGRFELTEFEVDSQSFIIQIEQKRLHLPSLNAFKTAEVSFFRKDLDGEKAFSTGNQSTIPSSVYGIVSNSLLDKFKEYDAFFCTAEKRHSLSQSEFETKVKIYSMISNKISKRLGAYYFEKESVDYCAFLVSRQKLSSEDQDSSGLKNPLNEAMKALGLGSRF